MKILITAFEPFDNNETNYSKEVLKNIKQFKNVEKLILPVEYYKAFEILKIKLDKKDYQIVILLGEARSYFSLGYEVIAINELSSKVDNKGLIPKNKKIIDNNIDGLFANLDYQIFEKSFKETKTSYHRSYSAGTYVCNALLYQTLLYLRENKKTTKCGFIHIPDLLKQDLNEIVNGFNNYINNLINTPE